MIQQIIAPKTKNWATWTTQKSEGWANVFCKGRLFCCTSSTRHVTLVKSQL